MKQSRNNKTLERGEYLSRSKEFAPHGQDLPHSKLMELDVVAIRSAARQRESLRQHIRDNLSNDALSKSFGVHVRTIEKVLQYYTWSHVA
jgi:hypothetical protein